MVPNGWCSPGTRAHPHWAALCGWHILRLTSVPNRVAISIPTPTFFLLMPIESITEVDIWAAAAPRLEGSGDCTLCIEPKVLQSCSTWLCPQRNKFSPHASHGSAEVKLHDSSQICTATVSAAELRYVYTYWKGYF